MLRLGVVDQVFAAGEAHGRGSGAILGLDVDEADDALFDLLPGALQGRADALGLFDIFGLQPKVSVIMF